MSNHTDIISVVANKLQAQGYTLKPDSIRRSPEDEKALQSFTTYQKHSYLLERTPIDTQVLFAFDTDTRQWIEWLQTKDGDTGADWQLITIDPNTSPLMAKGLKETHSTVVSSYKRQLSAAKTEQLKFLLRRSDFESTDAFNQIVDTGQLHTLFHKEKIKNLVITVAQHDTRISELNSQFNRQTPQLNRVRQSSLTASEELEVVHNLSIKAMEALNNDNEDLWATLICGSKGASYVGSHSWKGAKHYLGKISTYVILEKVPRPKITTNRSPSSSILYHVKNDDLATDHRLYKHNINFRFDTKSYNNEKPCVKLNY
jgi:hypothetical protein